MATILVTGGTGYIGSTTILELLRAGKYQPVAVDNLSNSDTSSLDRIREISGQHVPFHQTELMDWAAVQALFQQYPDIVGVIHFAALKAVGESVEQPYRYYQNNLESLLNIHRACVEFNIGNLIFSSSCSVYGDVLQLPVTEETPLNEPVSPYAQTKKLGEDILVMLSKIRPQVRTIALRYFNPVGADHTGKLGENQLQKPSNLVPFITMVAAGLLPKLTVFGNDYPTRDGTCVRDYIHVTDIAQAHLLALDYVTAGKLEGSYGLFNLGSGNGVTVLEAINAFESATGQQLNYEIGPRRPGDVAAIYSDSSYAARVLGWTPTRDVTDMMRSAWEWQKQLSTIN